MLDLLTYLGLFLYTLLASGMVGLMGTPCCCGSCAAACPNQPTNWQVVITGIANGSCATCSDFDGTYITTRRTSAFGLAEDCTWACNDIADSPCPGTQNTGVRVGLHSALYAAGPDELSVMLFWFLGATIIGQTIWAKAYTFPIDCALSNESIPWDSNPNGTALCDGTAATCLVTAVP